MIKKQPLVGRGSFLLLMMLLLVGCQSLDLTDDEKVAINNSVEMPTVDSKTAEAGKRELTNESNGSASWIKAEGMTVAERVRLPDGYERLETNAYGQFLRQLPLLPDGHPVLLYDGREKETDDHVAVLDIDVGQQDLQQCADAAIRLRAEYLFAEGAYNKISFHLTNGQIYPYEKYRQGYRLVVDGNKTSLQKKAEPDDSYPTFRKYLTTLYIYAGTLSVDKECQTVELMEMQMGDLFIEAGSPGHCVMVMDMCQNDTGRRLFLLGQSYMPAQQIHLLKNPASDSPWYSLDDLSYPFETPSWIFDRPCLKRFPDSGEIASKISNKNILSGNNSLKVIG